MFAGYDKRKLPIGQQSSVNLSLYITTVESSLGRLSNILSWGGGGVGWVVRFGEKGENNLFSPPSP